MVQITACQIPLIRMNSFSDFEKQVRSIFKHVPKESDYVVLPELCTLGLLTTYEDFEKIPITEYKRLCEYLDDYKSLFTSLAKERNQIIIAGTTLEAEGNQIFNTAYIFDASGEVLSHRKTHIFPAEAQWHTVEGDALQVFSIGPITFGIAICYEIEIPEVATIYQQQGADIIFCPSYTFTEHGFWRVRHCAQARAIENQVYVVHCPTKSEAMGIINPGFGQASILSPCDLPWTANGVLTEANEEQMVITTKVSLSKLYENRQTGAATTVKDRERRKALYRKQSLSF